VARMRRVSRTMTGAPPQLGRVAAAPPPTGSFQVCALCGREAKGFSYVHQLRSERYPRHRFCSVACFEPGALLAKRSLGMIDKSEMEARAVKHPRRALAEALVELGLMDAFRNRSAAEVDRVIEACIDGSQASMRRQAEERVG
jgi:Family of unknown function (DUF6511)